MTAHRIATACKAAYGAIRAIASFPATPNAWPPRADKTLIAISIPSTTSRANGAATSFDAQHHHAFQSLMERFGDPALLAGKRAAFAKAPEAFEDGDERRQAIGFRIGQRQRRWLDNSIAAES